MIAPATLALLLQACAPTVNPQTQAALVSVESNANAFALHDNNTDRSYYPTTYRAAVTLAESLIRAGSEHFGAHDAGVDVGIAQINSRNFDRYGLTPAIALDPCMNLRVGSLMLTTLYDPCLTR
jgi:type IV secretion system protein VirB1